MGDREGYPEKMKFGEKAKCRGGGGRAGREGGQHVLRLQGLKGLDVLEEKGMLVYNELGN